MAALYADENYPFPVVALLQAAGHDVLTALADGRANQGIPDPKVLDRAIALGRAVITTNHSDYKRLHRRRPNHAGIVVCTENLDFPALAGRVLAALAGVSDLSGQLIRITLPNPSSAQGP